MPNRIEVRSVTPSLIRDDSEQATKQPSGFLDTLTTNVYGILRLDRVLHYQHGRRKGQ